VSKNVKIVSTSVRKTMISNHRTLYISIEMS